jgi:hypothetical protein
MDRPAKRTHPLPQVVLTLLTSRHVNTFILGRGRDRDGIEVSD